ncbi:hypothetical protein T484DRAFT_1902869, partial [Baffinella frigidus]
MNPSPRFGGDHALGGMGAAQQAAGDPLQEGVTFELQDLAGGARRPAGGEDASYHQLDDDMPEPDQGLGEGAARPGRVQFSSRQSQPAADCSRSDWSFANSEEDNSLSKFDRLVGQNSRRSRPMEKIMSTVLFAAFVAVAVLVGVMCVGSVKDALTAESRTEKLLTTGREEPGSVAVQRLEQRGGSISTLQSGGGGRAAGGKRAGAHNWADHSFDMSIVDPSSPVHAAHAAGAHGGGGSPFQWVHHAARHKLVEDREHPQLGSKEISARISNVASYIVGKGEQPRASAVLQALHLKHNSILKWIRHGRHGRRASPAMAHGQKLSYALPHASPRWYDAPHASTTVAAAQRAVAAANTLIAETEPGTGCLDEASGAGPCVPVKTRTRGVWVDYRDRPGGMGKWEGKRD